VWEIAVLCHIDFPSDQGITGSILISSTNRNKEDCESILNPVESLGLPSFQTNKFGLVKYSNQCEANIRSNCQASFPPFIENEDSFSLHSQSRTAIIIIPLTTHA